jgi:hypothetical protein
MVIPCCLLTLVAASIAGLAASQRTAAAQSRDQGRNSRRELQQGNGEMRCAGMPLPSLTTLQQVHCISGGMYSVGMLNVWHVRLRSAR